MTLQALIFLKAELSSKRLELLRELVPSATRIAVLVTPSGISTASTIKNLNATANGAVLEIEVFKVSSSQDIDAAFMTFARQRPDATEPG